MPVVGLDEEDLGAAEGGQVDRLGGVDQAGVDEELEALQAERRVLPLGAEERKSRECELLENNNSE